MRKTLRRGKRPKKELLFHAGRNVPLRHVVKVLLKKPDNGVNGLRDGHSFPYGVFETMKENQ
jgi:hypothetical protein